MADAIGRTLFRLVVNRRLLEWITAAQSKHRRRAGWLGLYGTMAGSLVVAVLAAIFVAIAGADSLPIAAPFVLAWLVAPSGALWVSRPPRDAASLRLVPAGEAAPRPAPRRPRRFFQALVTHADHMLPPHP